MGSSAHKNKRSFLKFGEKKVSYFGELIKEKDMYGQPITLNYQGSDTYKTIPGGILSIILLVCVIAYGFLKGKYMVDKEEWSLI